MNLLLLIVAYICAPALLLRMHRSWGVPAAVLSLWLPVEFGLFDRVGVHPFATAAIAVTTCLLTFRSRKDVLDLRTAFNPAAVEWKLAGMAFMAFAAIAIPLGLGIGFIRPVFDATEVRRVPLMLLAIFFFNALPEEILFRGLIQNWIEERTGSRAGALAIAAAVFGVSHLNNGPPIPNYRYVLMASIAGIAYGFAWRSRRNVLTSAITHTLVNTGWNLFFR